MTEGDLDQVLAFERSGQEAPWSRKVFSDCLRAGYDCRMICVQDTSVGFMIVSSVLDEAHLLNIVLSPDWRGYGLGRTVLECVMDQLAHRGFACLYLEVRQSNERARILYERLGFAETGYRRNYYRTLEGGREDAVLMTRKLLS